MSLYEHAIRLKPEDGRAWNQVRLVIWPLVDHRLFPSFQMAVLNLATGKLLPGLYYYARALSVPILFQPASANMNQLFSKLTSTPSSSTLTDHDRQHEPANMNQLFSKMTSSSSSSTLVEHDRLFVQLHALIHQVSQFSQSLSIIDVVERSTESVNRSGQLSPRREGKGRWDVVVSIVPDECLLHRGSERFERRTDGCFHLIQRDHWSLYGAC